MTVSTTEPQFQQAMVACVDALRRIAQYDLDAGLARRMDELADRKEFLDESQHAELLALVTFVRDRNVEKLNAQVALQRLEALFPTLVRGN